MDEIAFALIAIRLEDLWGIFIVWFGHLKASEFLDDNGSCWNFFGSWLFQIPRKPIVHSLRYITVDSEQL
jgi:hypothetical protein